MDINKVKNLYSQHVMPTYTRADVLFVRGQGCTLYDETDKEYIDFASGIGVNSVGYAHPKWVSAVSGQASQLAHVSNLYHTLPGVQLAERLTALSGMKNVFFANSGAEANEGVIKLARKYSHDKYGDGRSTIVTLTNSFHGRTISTLSATGQDRFHQHFFPFTGGFVHLAAGDLAGLEAMDDDVCAVFVEPVQGEGGVLPMDAKWLQDVQSLCRKRDWLLLCDEVQTGIGRCGSWFAFQKYGLKPDVVSFAKGIAGGLPLGGFLAGERCAEVLGPGTHATTFGANPICCAAALSVLDILHDALPGVDVKGKYLSDTFTGAPHVREVRGMGLMLGIAVDGTPGFTPAEISARALKQGLVCLTAGSDAVRLLPPLTISDTELSKGVEILKHVLSV